MIKLKELYKKEKPCIKRRLREFKNLQKSKDRDIFSELCFCILTPQSKAVSCDNAIKNLKNSDILFKGTLKKIRNGLTGVRFPNNKASYLVSARKLFTDRNKSIDIKNRLNLCSPKETREWLVKNIKGIGYKEASHFLRNIGLGKDIAILDVHILRNLKKYGVIKEIPKSINKKTYFDIENKMKKFSQKIGIPLDELDLLFWSKETGFIFK